MPEPQTGPVPWEYTIYIPNDPRAVAICRRTVRLILTAHDLPHFTEAAELLATELVTNAVQHTKGPAALRLRAENGTLRIGVWDADPTPPRPPRHPTPDAETGRGLTLVHSCANTWGWSTNGTSGTSSAPASTSGAN
ncbi:anti-sigma regulatory factor (Ser/Thr protein kinase) [Streptomyces sp. Ag82_O1-15]|jgi:anti-sigma regulatory factor (Ser/Thr protein kinase)|uniref:ATP-binding protein n=1 Tax=Streptomyces sp. Ag82_O1-15 TaxID=1938855 RepID=UPI000BDD856C|nr:ATP-binding protein [Streptomyces sp. Ag82_O1-15]PBC97582.1 anti-sigma regulatory factor (Ser/Thr protein kinase) [Streptomyces sp. Ag82_O1-15]